MLIELETFFFFFLNICIIIYTQAQQGRYLLRKEKEDCRRISFSFLPPCMPYILMLLLSISASSVQPHPHPSSSGPLFPPANMTVTLQLLLQSPEGKSLPLTCLCSWPLAALPHFTFRIWSHVSSDRPVLFPVWRHWQSWTHQSSVYLQVRYRTGNTNLRFPMLLYTAPASAMTQTFTEGKR